jgi:hypothetical protein
VARKPAELIGKGPPLAGTDIVIEQHPEPIRARQAKDAPDGFNAFQWMIGCG